MSPGSPRSLVALLLLFALPIPAATQPPLIARLGTRQAHQKTKVTSLLFAPDGRTLATLDSQGTIRLWDVASRKQRACWGDEKTPFRCMAYSADARMLAGAAKTAISLWDPATGRALRSLPHSRERITSIGFSPDGNCLAVAQRTRPRVFSSPVQILDVRSGKLLQNIAVPTLHEDAVMNFLQDGKTLAVWGVLWTFWDVASGADLTRHFTGEHFAPRAEQNHELIFRWRGDHNIPATFSASGRLLALGRSEVTVYDMLTGRERCSFLPGDLDRCHFSSDNRVLVVHKFGVEDMVYLWEVNTGRQLSPFVCLDQPCDAEALGPDGATLATAMRDGTIELHDIRPRGWTRVRRSRLASWELRRCWNELRSSAGWAADEAAWMLAADPQQSLPLLREHLHRLSSDEEIGRLILDLDSDQFPTRERATQELQRIGAAAEPALRRIVMERPSLELRRRVKDLLDDIDRHGTAGPMGESLRAVRAIRALERMETKEARAILEDLAHGGVGAWQTQEAREAVQRLKLRFP